MAIWPCIALGQTGFENSGVFDGREDMLVMREPSIGVKDVTTLEMWIKPDVNNNLTGYQSLWSYSNFILDAGFWDDDGWVDYAYEVGLKGGYPYIHINRSVNNGISAKEILSPVKVSSNEWVHLAFIYDDKDAKMYINGELVKTSSGVNTGRWTMHYPKLITIGASSSRADEPFFGPSFEFLFDSYFHGKIDEIRIWSDERTQKELIENRHRTISTSESGLIHYLQMNSVTSQGIIDKDYYYTEKVKNDRAYYEVDLGWIDEGETVGVDAEDATVSRSNDVPDFYGDYDVLASNSGSVSFGGLNINVPTSTQQEPAWISGSTDAIYLSRNNISGQTTTYLLDSLMDRWDVSWNVWLHDPDNKNGWLTMTYDFGLLDLEDHLNGDWPLFLLYRENSNASFRTLPAVGTALSGNQLTFKIHGSFLKTGEYTVGRGRPQGYKAIVFDGQNDYLETPNIALGSSDFSMEFWAKPQGSGTQPLLSHDTISLGSGIYLEVDVLNESASLQVKDEITAFSNPLFGSGSWGHYAITYQASTKNIRLYVNGYRAVDKQLTSGYAKTSKIRLGIKNQKSFEQFYEGQLDEFRVWDKVLTQEELRQSITESVADNAAGLRLYYRFDEPQWLGGQVMDRSGHYATAYAFQALNRWSTTPIVPQDANTNFSNGGKAISLNGATEYASTPYISAYGSTNALSVEAWAYPDFASSTHHGRVVSQQISGPADRFELAIINGKPTFRYEDNNGNELDKLEGAALAQGKWYHLAVSHSTTEMVLYVDGFPVARKANPVRLSNGTGTLFVGGTNQVTGENFKGKLDEVRVWNRALTIKDVIQNRGTQLTGMEPNLAALFNFNFTSGKLEDASGYQNDGTLQNIGSQNFVLADWNVNTNTNILDANQRARVVKDGLRPVPQGFLTGNNVLALGAHDDGVPSVQESRSGAHFVWSRSWYINTYDASGNYTNALALEFVPNEANINMSDFVDLDISLLYRQSLTEDYQTVSINNVLVKDSNVVNIELPFNELKNGYYTLGFTRKAQGLALAFSNNSQSIRSNNFTYAIEGREKTVYEFWVSPSSLPSHDIHFIGFETPFSAFELSQPKNTNQLSLYLKRGSDNWQSTLTTLTPNQWQHIALYIDEDGFFSYDYDIELYVNGASVYSGTSGNFDDHVFEFVRGYPFDIGDSIASDTLKIDEFRFWNDDASKVDYWDKKLEPKDFSRLQCQLSFDKPGSPILDATRNRFFFLTQAKAPDFTKADWYLTAGDTHIDFDGPITEESGGLTVSSTYQDGDLFDQSGIQKISWSHSVGQTHITSAGMPNSALGRLGKTWEVTPDLYGRNGKVYFTFDSDDLGLDSVYPNRNKMLLYTRDRNQPFTRHPIYGVHQNPDHSITMAVESRVLSSTGYYTMGWTSDFYDRAYQFNRNYALAIRTDSSFSLNDSFTFEAWVKPSELFAYHTIAQQGDFILAIQPSKKVVFKSGSTDSIISTTVLDTGKWYHIAAVHTGNQARLHVNGVGNTATSSTQAFNQNRMVVGASLGSWYTNYFKGALDEIRIWDAALDSQKLADGATQQMVGNESGLLHYYRFNQPSGDSIPDHSANLEGLLFDGSVNTVDATDKFGTEKPTGTKVNSGTQPLSLAGLRLRNHTSQPFIKTANDRIELAYIGQTNGWNAANRNPQFSQTMTRRWFVQLQDEGDNGGLLRWEFLLDSAGVTHQASKDRTYYLIQSQSAKGPFKVIPVLSSTLSQNANEVHFVTEAGNLTNAYYSLAYSDLGWGQAFKLDGSNDHFSLGKLDQMSWQTDSAFTLEAWVEPNGTGTLFSKTSGANQGVAFSITSGNYLRGELGASGATLISSKALVPNQNNHVVMAYDGDSMKFYINGSRAGVRKVGKLNDASAFEAFIGAGTNNGQRTELLSANLDEFRIWKRELRAYEVRNYALTNVLNEKGIAYNFRFNQSNTRRFGNAGSVLSSIAGLNINTGDWQTTPLREYIVNTIDLERTGQTTGKVEGLTLSAATSGKSAFFKADNDHIFMGHTLDSVGVSKTHTPSGIAERWNHQWRININDYQLDGGEIDFEFSATNNWNGPQAQRDYFLLYRRSLSGDFRLVNYGQYEADLSQKEVRFTVSANRLKSGYYTLGYTELSDRFTASDAASDAHINIKYQVPASCFQNIGSRPVKLEVENSDNKVVFEKRLDSFSLSTALIDSFTHYVDSGVTDHFEMHLYRIGPGTKVCDGQFSDSGSTRGHVPPKLETDSVYLHKHVVEWQVNSDHINRFRLIRHDVATGDSFTTILDSTARNFTDSVGGLFNAQNGKRYRYCVQVQSTKLNKFYQLDCTTSRTKAIDFKASDAEYADTVEITWNGIDAYTDKLELTRDGVFYAVLRTSDSSYIDEDPVHGKKHVYGINVYQNNSIILHAQDTGWVPPKGTISGRVVTLTGQYAVPNCTVMATSQILDSLYTYQTTTDATGYFELNSLYFGTGANYTITPSKSGHSFVNNSQSVRLSSQTAHVNDVKLQSVNLYNDGSRSLTNFKPSIAQKANYLEFSWTLDSKLPALVQVFRKDSLLTILPDSQTFIYGDALPGEKQQFSMVAYVFSNDSVTVSRQTQSITPNGVEAVKGQTFSAQANADFATVELDWEYDTRYIDGFAVYRNGKWLADVKKETEFKDRTGINGERFRYTVSAWKELNGKRYESDTVGASATYPTLKAPSGLKLVANQSEGSVKGNFLYQVPGNYQYQGLLVNRVSGTDTVLVTTVNPGKSPFFVDTSGVYGTSYTYLIKAFKDSKKGHSASISGSAQFPEFPKPTIARHTELGTGAHTYQVDWTPNIQVYSGTRLATSNDTLWIPFGRQSQVYSVLSNQSGKLEQYLQTYSWKNGQQIFSPVCTLSTTVSAQSTGLRSIESFAASSNFSGFVNLSWKYVDYIRPTFYIYRDGALIDSVAYDVREYRDFDAVPGRLHTYLLQAAFSGGNSSQRSGMVQAYGKSNTQYTVAGEVRNQYTNNGVENTVIEVTSGTGADRFAEKGKTDKTGYYEINIPGKSFYAVNVRATKQNHLYSPQRITTNDSVQRYAVNFTDTTRGNTSRTTEIAEIKDLFVTSDESRQQVLIRFNVSNANFSTVEIFRGPVVLATIRKGEALTYLDTSGIPGFTYVYGIRTRWNTKGNVLYSTREEKVVDYPQVLPVATLTGIPSDSLNHMVLKWAHPNQRLDFYRIYRNDEFIAQVSVNDFSYIDETGIPGKRYRYAIEAVVKRGSREVVSERVSARASYPYFPRVKNLSGTRLADSNAIRLDWNYWVSKTRGYIVIRNNVIIDTVWHQQGVTQYDYVDKYGIPSTNNEYTITPYTFVGNEFTKAVPATANVVFPALAAPTNLLATPKNGEDRVNLLWEYPTDNIDGFVVYRDGVELTKTNANNPFFADETGLPNTQYLFAVAAYSLRNGQQYVSPRVEASATFPKVAAPKQLIASQYTSQIHVLLNWEHDGWLQAFDEERGYEIEYADWQVTSDLLPSETNVPTSVANWISLSNNVSYQERYFVHQDLDLQDDVRYGTDDIGSYRYRIRSFRKIGGVKYYSNYSYTGSAGLTLFSQYDHFQPQNLVATQGTKTNLTTLTWTDRQANHFNFRSYKIYRKGFPATSFELIGSVAGGVEIYHDDEGIAGNKYIYEVRPDVDPLAPGATYERGAIAVGWSASNGSISGSVITSQNASPVQGVSIQASARIGKQLYVYQDVTDAQGEYELEEVFFNEKANYTVKASYLDHEFVANEKIAALSTKNPSQNLSPFVDLNSFVVRGRVTRKGTNCGVDSVRVRVFTTLNDGTVTTLEGYSQPDGTFSIVYAPRAENVRLVEVMADTFTVYLTRPNRDTVFHKFSSNYLRISNPASAPTETIFNLEENTLVPVEFELKTTCGPIPGSPVFTLNIQSVDGCYNAVQKTDASGRLSLELPRMRYRVSVVGASPVTQANYPYVEYFGTIIKDLDYRSTPENQTQQVSFIYHTIANITYQGLNRYCGNDATQPAVVTTGNRYSVKFEVKENQNGGCHVGDGFLIVENRSLSKNVYDTLNITSNGSFETYTFIPDNPNPSEPFTRLLRAEYHTEDQGYQTEKLIPLIVEGISEIPGNDIVVNPSENGDVQMPLFVLRDPPGDQSYSYIEEGATFTQKVSFDKQFSLGFNPEYENAFALFGVGLKVEFEGNASGGSGETYDYEVTSTITKNIETASESQILNKDASNYLMQEDADVIVGAGLVSKYGLTWDIRVPETKGCTVEKTSVIANGIGDISTTWIYNVDHIEGLIGEYQDKIEQLEAGTLVVTGETKEESLAKFKAYKENWEQVLKFHRYETLPHVNLCDRLNYQKLPQPWQNYLQADDTNPYWTGALGELQQTLIEVPKQQQENVVKLAVQGFCENIGYYDGADFILNDDTTIWSEELISDYNAIHSMIYDWESSSSQFLKIIADFDYGEDDNQVGWSEEYNWRFGPQARNITFSGGGSYEESLSASKTKARTKMTTTNLGFDLFVGTAHKISVTALNKEVVSFEGANGLRTSLSWEYEESISNEVDTSKTIGFVLSDDDPGDQYSVTVVNGIQSGHTPYFALLGGRSSCPAEPGTINRDQYDMQLGDIDGNTYSPTQRFLDPDEPAIFKIRITNNSPFNEGRWYALYLNTNSNRRNASVRVYGNEVGTRGVDFFLEPGQSEYFDLYVYRAPGVYAHEDIQPDLQVDCDEYFEHRILDLKAYWLHPCTDVSVVSEDNALINRQLNEPESYTAVLGGYDLDNELLQQAQVKYRRKGTADWTTIAVIPRDSLVAYYNRFAMSPPRPAKYPVIWDITQNPAILDGEYELKADYLCERVGWLSSNVVNITVDRNTFKPMRKPEPADAVLSLGEGIYVDYNKFISAGNIKAGHIKTTVHTKAGNLVTDLPISVHENRIEFELSDSLRKAWDGYRMTVLIDSLFDANSNLHQKPVEWSFTISHNPVFWYPAVLTQEVYSGRKTPAKAKLLYAKFQNVLSYSILPTKYTWLTVRNANGVLPLKGMEVQLEIDARNLAKGIYHDTLLAVVQDYGTVKLPVEITVHHQPPRWKVNPADYEQNVHVISNYRVDNALVTSTDTMDMIAAFIGSECRGVSRIIKTGARYAAYVPVYGNTKDNGQAVHFRVWNAASGVMYDAYLPNNDTIKFNPATALHGSFSGPRILEVNTARDRVRAIPLQKGWNWLSLNLQQKQLEGVFNSLSSEDGDLVKTLSQTSEFTDQFGGNGTWVSANGLQNIKPENGYLLKLSKADTLYVSGDTANVQSLNLAKGWNLMGYPRQEPADVNRAFRLNNGPANDDILKSQKEVAVFGGTEWNGSLTELEPYQAYMMRLGQAAKASFKNEGRPEIWEVNPSEFEFNMTVTARLEMNGNYSQDTNDIVGAFIEGELRGVGKLCYLPQIGKYRVVLFVYSDQASGQDIAFKLYDADQETLYDAHESLEFVANLTEGKLSEPYLFTDKLQSGVKLVTSSDGRLTAFPNPFESQLTVLYETQEQRPHFLEITDMLGRTVFRETVVPQNGQVSRNLSSELSKLEDGMYQVRISTEGQSSSIKIIKH